MPERIVADESPGAVRFDAPPPRLVSPSAVRRATTSGLATACTLALAFGGLAAVAPAAAADASHTRRRPPPERATGASATPAPSAESRSADVLVTAPAGLDRAQVAKVRALSEVRSVETADLAEVTIAGHRATLLGVHTATFRAYTPKPTARADGLWRNIAAGDLAVSFAMGRENKLPLSSRVGVRAAWPAHLRVGALATMGISGVDAVVADSTARGLGVPRDNALVISAPKADGPRLAKRLKKALPHGTDIDFQRSLQPVSTTGPGRAGARQDADTPTDAHGFLSRERIDTAIKAAFTKLGRPYVWGAEGPDSFDCSGLVQWAFGKAGVRMPRVTDQQFLTGEHLPYAQARRGDLLFWRNDPTAPNYVSHVAIYLGHGKMIVAPHTGDVVKIEDVYLKNFAGAVRIQVRR